MRTILPHKRQLLGIRSLYIRFLSSEGASDSPVLERWLQNWTATPPASPLFDGADPPTALSWARRRGPNPPLPDAIIHRLFRNEAIRVWDPSTDQIKRVKKETLLPLGARLLFPQKILDAEELGEAENVSRNGSSSSKKRHSSPVKTDAAPSAAATAAATILKNSVIFENEDLIAINKPPGLAVQGGSGVKISIDALLPLAFPAQFPTSSSSSASSYDNLKLVHRLDREVTGVLLLGKGSDATARLSEAFRGKSLGATGIKTVATVAIARKKVSAAQPAVEKIYWALVVNPSLLPSQISSSEEGRGKERKEKKDMTLSALKKGSIGYLDAPITATQKNILNETRKTATATTTSTGTTVAAVTRYKVLHVDKTSNIAWLELEPLTGRKHQLRQHCARDLGLPILGDGKYGLVRKEPQKSILTSILAPKNQENTGKKEVPLFLHCRSIKIDIPGQRKGLTIQAPVPEIWRELFSQQGWSPLLP